MSFNVVLEHAGGPDAGGGGCNSFAAANLKASVSRTQRAESPPGAGAGPSSDLAGFLNKAVAWRRGVQQRSFEPEDCEVLPHDILLFLLAESEHRVRELEDLLVEEAQRHDAAHRASEELRAAAPPADVVPTSEKLSPSQGLRGEPLEECSVCGTQALDDSEFCSTCGSKLAKESKQACSFQPACFAELTGASDVGADAERRAQYSPSQDSTYSTSDAISNASSSCSTSAGNEAVSSIREALLQLEPVSRGEDIWVRLGAMLEELRSLRSRVAEQSKRNQRLRKEVDEQRELLRKVGDLELQNRLFASRIPQGLALMQQRSNDTHAPEDLQTIEDARHLWEHYFSTQEELNAERQRRTARCAQEQADRDMVPLLQRKIDETREAAMNCRARMRNSRRILKLKDGEREGARSVSPAPSRQQTRDLTPSQQRDVSGQSVPRSRPAWQI